MQDGSSPRAADLSALDGVALLRDQPIAPGERWLYSAGFNVSEPVGRNSRVECELDDLERLAEAGARVAIVSHQGSARDGSARDIGFLAPYLQSRLRRPVAYIPDPLAADTQARVRCLDHGELALLGNTRLLDGEEECDPWLALHLAQMGERVAVGGFSKAHRVHASNVGVLTYLPGYASSSLVRELELLAPWAGLEVDSFSVAVMGGIKREKLECGLVGFARSYDLLVPGGAVLNCLLHAAGYDVGNSSLGECGESLAIARQLLANPGRARLHLPERVVVTRGRRPEQARVIPVRDGVPTGWEIVDFELQPWATKLLRGLPTGARAVIAGTPSLYSSGFTGASQTLLEAFSADGVQGLLLGGDTATELPWKGPVSTGGGSALWFLAYGSLPVLEALSRRGRQ